MPNQKILDAIHLQVRSRRLQGRRVHRRYQQRVPELLEKLGSDSQAIHDKAFDLLAQMSMLIVPELIAVLEDPQADPLVQDEAGSLLGLTGDLRAREPLLRLLDRVQGNYKRMVNTALSLSGLGESSVLPILRRGLKSRDRNLISNAVAAMIAVGELEDVPRLRKIHRHFRTDPEIRMGTANAILAILEENGMQAVERTLDDIRESFADRALWEDIWELLEQSYRLE